MKKKLITMLVCSLCMTTLFGCSSISDKKESTKQEESKNEKKSKKSKKDKEKEEDDEEVEEEKTKSKKDKEKKKKEKKEDVEDDTFLEEADDEVEETDLSDYPLHYPITLDDGSVVDIYTKEDVTIRETEGIAFSVSNAEHEIALVVIPEENYENLSDYWSTEYEGIYYSTENGNCYVYYPEITEHTSGYQGNVYLTYDGEHYLAYYEFDDDATPLFEEITYAKPSTMKEIIDLREDIDTEDSIETNDITTESPISGWEVTYECEYFTSYYNPEYYYDLSVYVDDNYATEEIKKGTYLDYKLTEEGKHGDITWYSYLSNDEYRYYIGLSDDNRFVSLSGIDAEPISDKILTQISKFL